MEKRNITITLSLAEYYDVMASLVSTRDFYDITAKGQTDINGDYLAFMSRRFTKVIYHLRKCKDNNK